MGPFSLRKEHPKRSYTLTRGKVTKRSIPRPDGELIEVAQRVISIDNGDSFQLNSKRGVFIEDGDLLTQGGLCPWGSLGRIQLVMLSPRVLSVLTAGERRVGGSRSAVTESTSKSESRFLGQVP